MYIVEIYAGPVFFLMKLQGDQDQADRINC